MFSGCRVDEEPGKSLRGCYAARTTARMAAVTVRRSSSPMTKGGIV
jgi:hypothetical protein